MNRQINKNLIANPIITIRIEPEEFFENGKFKENNNRIRGRKTINGFRTVLSFNTRNAKNIKNFFSIYARLKNDKNLRHGFKERFNHMKRAGIVFQKTKKIQNKIKNMKRLQRLPRSLNEKVIHPMGKRILQRSLFKSLYNVQVLNELKKKVKKVQTGIESEVPPLLNNVNFIGPFAPNGNYRHYVSRNGLYKYYPTSDRLVVNKKSHYNARSRFKIPNIYK